ncbi:MAG TPA: DUF1614 domain-containing protein [Candidatus Acidoferrales bacterium]|nr:DUF1614 domain-containing protein [Candidatus Acidoferrales bacterium]
MMYPGCLALIVVVLLLFLLPFFFAQVMLIALTKLGLNPYAAFFIIMGIIAGSLINIPVKRFYRDEEILDDSLRMFGFSRLFALPRVVRHHVTIGVNIGGCVVPSLLAVYECFLVARRGPDSVVVLLAITLANIAVCYRIARPIPRVGLAIPALIPPLVSAGLSLLLIPDFAPPVAFVAGVLGPLIGADLLHLREMVKISPAMASIGGAGTFDGIILSGLIAALLA